MTLKQLGNNIFSLALGSAILFGAGLNTTTDAILATVVWVILVFAIIGLLLITIVTAAVSTNEAKKHEKTLAPFFAALQKMQTGILQRVVSFALTVYWLYAFVVHEWTATAVIYTIVAIWGYLFTYLTKDLVKEYFLNSLKGSSS